MDWHQSGIEDYWICGERFRRNHLTGEIRADSASNLQGKAVHHAMAVGLVELMENGHLFDANAISHEARDYFNVLVDEDEESEEPIPWSSGEVFRERLEEVGIMAYGLWKAIPGLLATFGPPVSVEKAFSDVPVTKGITIAGTWDLLTEDDYIIDWKTSRTSWRPGDEKKKIQPVAYARGVEYVIGRWPKGFVYVVVNRNGQVRIKPVPIPEEKLRFLEQTLEDLESARKNGIYPMNPTSGLCSETHCTWFRRGCPAAVLKGAV